MSQTATTAGATAQAGKYLTFALANEIYGLQILKVQEIIGMMTVTRVPRTPDFIRGVINLRGKVIPVVDLRRKFGLEDHKDTEKTCIIVVQIAQAQRQTTMGILVDEVSEVINITAEQIEPTPEFGAAVDTAFILGMGKVGQKVLTLLDIDRVLSTSEVSVIQEAVATN